MDSKDRECVLNALHWHEYGSQDERREKALPAFERICDEVERLQAELEQERELGRDADADVLRLTAEVERLRVIEQRARAFLSIGFTIVWDDDDGQEAWELLRQAFEGSV